MKLLTSVAVRLLILLASASASAQRTPTQLAEDAARKIDQHKADALKADSLAIFDELDRLRQVVAIKSRGTAFPDLTDPDMLKATGYAAALEERRKANEPQGAHLWARYNSRICGSLDSNPIVADAAKKCWAETLEAFRVGSEGGIARSSFNIGLIYENGWGVSRSRFLAADWYVKAAERYIKEENREGSLEAVEAALRVVPDLPAAQRLRVELHR